MIPLSGSETWVKISCWDRRDEVTMINRLKMEPQTFVQMWTTLGILNAPTTRQGTFFHTLTLKKVLSFSQRQT